MNDAKSQVETAANAMITATNDIKEKTEDVFQCQHYELKNTTDDSNGRKQNTQNTQKLFGKDTPFVQIETAYDPDISYIYDEAAYMTILADDNVMIQHLGTNDAYIQKGMDAEGTLGPDYNNTTNASVKAYLGPDEYCLNGGDASKCQEITLARNRLHSIYYNPTTKWEVDSDQSKKYEDTAGKIDLPGGGKPANDKYYDAHMTLCQVGMGSGSYAKNARTQFSNDIVALADGNYHYRYAGGRCYDYTLKFVKAHYFQSSIENGSFYRNKGIWYKSGNDIREHGETLDEALMVNSQKRSNPPDYSGYDPMNWSVFVGTKTGSGVVGNYNLFPVSITTKRNMYQYTYIFKDIGVYTNNDLGRLTDMLL